MSTRNPTHGTKVKDPSAPQIEEGGAVIADSLAAESTRAGGEYAENKDSEPLSVSGSNSTFATTDTSAAKTLTPAKDSESRSEPQSYTTASDGKREGFRNSSSSGEESHAGVAPSYVNSQYVDHGKPKGKNITEDPELHGKNASFNNEIGTRNDPGRMAEAKFAQQNADKEGNMAGMPKQMGYGDDNVYSTIRGDSST